MQRKREWPDDDKVTEAGIESFPASDPPAHNMPGRSADGSAAPRRRTKPQPRMRARRLGSIAIAVVAVALSILVIWLLFR